MIKSYLVLIMLAFSLNAYAQPSPQPSGLSAIASQIQAAPSLDATQLLADVMAVAQGVKGSIPVAVKIAGLVLLVLALVKTSFLQFLWDKLGAFKPLAAPFLGLVFGILMFSQGGHISIAAVLAYMGSGAGAIGIHELLDAVKAIPGLGATYVYFINLFEGFLGGGSDLKAVK